MLASNEEVPQLEMGLEQPMHGKGGSMPMVRLSPMEADTERGHGHHGRDWPY